MSTPSLAPPPELQRRFEARLMRSGFSTAEKLWERSQRQALDGFEPLLIAFYASRGQLSRFLLWIFEREIEEISDPMELLRRSSESLSATLLNRIFFDQSNPESDGMVYLWSVLSPFVREVTMMQPLYCDALIGRCHELIVLLAQTAPLCPPLIRVALKMLKMTVHQYHPQVGDIIPSVFFLHYFCPALMQPAAYGLSAFAPDADALRNLIVSCKILQCVANNTTEMLGFASSTKKLKKLVVSSQEMLSSFFDEITSVADLKRADALQRKMTLVALANFCFKNRISKVLTAQLDDQIVDSRANSLPNRVPLITALRIARVNRRTRSVAESKEESRHKSSATKGSHSRETSASSMDRAAGSSSTASIRARSSTDPMTPPQIYRHSQRISIGSESFDEEEEYKNSNDQLTRFAQETVTFASSVSEDFSTRGDCGDLCDRDIPEDSERNEDTIVNDSNGTIQVPPMTMKRIVRSIDNSMLSLEDIVSGSQLTLVVLLRHFGCLLCKKLVHMLAQAKHTFDSVGVRLVAIGNGTPVQADVLKKEYNLDIDIFSDVSRNIYRDLQAKRGWCRVVFTRKGLKARFTAMREGYSQHETLGDDFQNGGVYLFSGDQILYRHIERFSGDYPDMATVLAACGGADLVGQLNILTPKEQKLRLKQERLRIQALNLNQAPSSPA